MVFNDFLLSVDVVVEQSIERLRLLFLLFRRLCINGGVFGLVFGPKIQICFLDNKFL